jgi:hypothetical protein
MTLGSAVGLTATASAQRMVRQLPVVFAVNLSQKKFPVSQEYSLACTSCKSGLHTSPLRCLSLRQSNRSNNHGIT